jgi:phosphatidylserine/phosphatidylglycerophosphate/cardiolipin synthase-like enzyme
VRDSAALWLSSCNWQSSNQPAADPGAEQPPKPDWLLHYNREWHAVVEHAGLAQTFERFLLHDYDHNQGTDAVEALGFPDLFVPAWTVGPTAQETAGAFQYFPPFDAKRSFTVLPLLTPDNYHAHVLALIRGATSEVLIQNQTFKAPKEGQTALAELIDALLAKQQEGVRLRIIYRLFIPKDARDVLSDLVDRGFDSATIRLQKNCHTKGIVVDRKRVLLGSHNWSNDGVSVNRDASLLFDDEQLANYFAGIFEHDWTNLARQDIGSEWAPLEAADPAASPPAGMVRVSWKEYLELG